MSSLLYKLCDAISSVSTNKIMYKQENDVRLAYAYSKVYSQYAWQRFSYLAQPPSVNIFRYFAYVLRGLAIFRNKNPQILASLLSGHFYDGVLYTKKSAVSTTL